MSSQEMINACTQTLSGFASKGFFNGFSVSKTTSNLAEYQFRWHFNCDFELKLNTKSKKITMPMVLPLVKSRSAMDKDFREFINELSDPDLPDHRRFNEKQLSVTNKDSKLSLSMQLPDDVNSESIVDEVGKFISVIHQVFKIFLKNGQYDEYVSGTYRIDADSFW
jgi:hypothetical protein